MSARANALRSLLALLLLLAPAALRAADPPPITVRSGSHPGFGRLVLDLPAGASATIAASQGQLIVQATGAVFGPAPRLPPNLHSIDVVGGQATLSLAQGAGWRSMRLPGRLVIDLLDPPRSVGQPAPELRRVLWSGPPSRQHALPPPAPAPLPAPPPAAAMPPPAPSFATAPPPAPPAPPPPVAATSVPPLPAPTRPAGPVALAVTMNGHTLTLPFAATTGAAAFRRGDMAVAVFDEPRPLDLASLHDNALFGQAQVQLLPAATVLRLPLAPGDTLRLARVDAGWALTVTAEAAAAPLAPIRPDAVDGRLRLPAASPSQVVSVPDPATGAALLVGTEHTSGEAVPVTRRAPDYGLLATFQGVAVEPVSDEDVLRVAPPGFVLEGGAGRPLAMAPADAGTLAAADAARLTRRWDLPALPVPALLRRLQAAMDDAANAPPQARAARRLLAVQAQLALGLDAEAEALARLAATDDALAAEAPDAAGLAAVAALLAGRDGDSAAIEDPRLTGTDEVALWRAVRRAQAEEGAPAAATVFSATLPLLLAYPAPLRERLLPLAAETMALGGERDAARRLLAAHKDDATLDYARALLDEADGHAAPALAMLDRLAQSSDRLLRARAAVRAVELRLRTGALTPAQAADALDRLIYAWRGDGRDLALRLRVAELRAQTGAWRAALTLLRDTADGPPAQNWPDQVPALRARMQSVFAAALNADARTPLAPFDLVALLDENPDLLPAGTAGQPLAVRLADRLAALDLPDRTTQLLQKLVDGTPPGAARAELGARLAALRLDQGDATAALTALSASAADNLAPPLVERRTITFARATAARGALGPAVAALAALDSPAATEARASLLEAAKDWPAAEAALADYARLTLPAQGTLDEAAGRTLLRLAAAAAQAGDEAMLARVRTDELPRLPPGKVADMLRVLTESPVAGVPDLPRSAQEAALARALPSDLHALGWTTAPTPP